MTKNVHPMNSDFTKSAIPSRIRTLDQDGSRFSVRFSHLTLQIPDTDQTLIENLNLTLHQGDRVALTGGNGTGKSSLFRVLRGLWDQGSGAVETTGMKQARFLCASQKPRLPDTTLPGMISYPHAPDIFTNEDYEAVLYDVGLPQLALALPWKMVKADQMHRLCADFLDAEITSALTKINGAQLPAFTKALTASLEKNLRVPSTLEEYFQPEQKQKFMETLTAHIQGKAKELNLQNKRSGGVFWPSRFGKTTGHDITDKILARLDKNIITGGRLNLSGGEEQKLVFARIFLQKPDILFLDEITSDLHQETAHELYNEMVNRLPESIMISIVHNDTLLPYHTHHANLQNKKLVVHDISLTDITTQAPCPQCPYKMGISGQQ